MPEQKKAVVPRLRFPEFRDAGPWELKRLGEVLEEHGLKSTGTEKVYSVSVHKGLVDQIEHLGRSFAAQNTDHYNRVLPGDVVYTKSPTGDFPYGIVKQNKTGQTVIVSPLYGVFRPQNYAIGVMLDAYFESPFRTKKFLEPLVQKGAKNTINISNDRLLSGALPLPRDQEEQQKIADCLSSLDELIELQAKKLEALQAHKKGLMQQLFPREGETTPRLRFPEFRDAGPWEVKRLGEVGTIIKGKGISKSDIKPNGILPCIRYGELYTHYSEVIRTIVSFTDADPGDLVLSQQNDLIIPASGETKEDIATASCVMLDGVALGGDLNIFRSPIDGRFLAYYVRGNLKTQIAKVAQGDSVVHLYPSQLEKVELGVPHEPAEQQKIADCLSSLDELIELQAKQLEALQAHKKGLMQQLFPQEIDL